MTAKILIAMITVLGLTACENDGPAERFGEQVDQAASNAQNAASNAADTVGDAARDAGNIVEDACEDVTDRNC